MTVVSTLNKYFSGTWVTILLILINIVVFLNYAFEKVTAPLLLDLGANFAPLTLGDEPERMLTSLFLHGGFFHLVINMYSLYFVGSQLEKRVGSINFLFFYFITGLIAGLTSLYFNLFVVSVGASGAIFGLYGFLVIQTIRENPENSRSVIINFIIYLVIVLLIGSQVNFDNAAHFGGALSGLLIGFLFFRLPAYVLFGISSLMIFVAYSMGPRHQTAYFEAFQKFITADKLITSTLSAPLSDEVLRDTLLYVSPLPDSVISHFKKLDFVDERLSGDTATIIAFTTLRKHHIDYLLKIISEESYVYLDSIAHNRSRFRKLSALEYPLNISDGSPLPPPAKSDTTEKLVAKREFYDFSWLPTNDSVNFSFYRIGKVDSLGDWQGPVKDYYRDGAIQMKGNYKRGLRDGIFLYYNPDSTYSSAGRYFRDNETGKWELYHANGKLSTEIRYENRSSYVENLWDSLGIPLVVDRNGEEVYRYPGGQISYIRTIRDGLTVGFKEAYYENGDLSYKEYYERGELLKGIAYDGNLESTYDRGTYMPVPNGGLEKFYQYLDEKNKLRSDSIDADVVLRFDVHRSGKITNIRYLKRYEAPYDRYAKTLLLEGPQWLPAKIRGIEPTDSYAEITIRF
ncbi:MAG: rhomboid family intramembrane serine protease [Cyclobacteriaceae bacterium]